MTLCIEMRDIFVRLIFTGMRSLDEPLARVAASTRRNYVLDGCASYIKKPFHARSTLTEQPCKLRALINHLLMRERREEKREEREGAHGIYLSFLIMKSELIPLRFQ